MVRVTRVEADAVTLEHIGFAPLGSIDPLSTTQFPFSLSHQDIAYERCHSSQNGLFGRLFTRASLPSAQLSSAVVCSNKRLLWKGLVASDRRA
eukprot:scaffold2191_cov254-Pinguiococcus_pyrenoidosus.AAC.28